MDGARAPQCHQSAKSRGDSGRFAPFCSGGHFFSGGRAELPMHNGKNLAMCSAIRWTPVGLLRGKSERSALRIPIERQRHCREQSIERQIHWLGPFEDRLGDVWCKECQRYDPAWISALDIFCPCQVARLLVSASECKLEKAGVNAAVKFRRRAHSLQIIITRYEK